jgi:hypothetical protein
VETVQVGDPLPLHTEFLNLEKMHDCITLGFAKNVCFTNKKGMEKLI